MATALQILSNTFGVKAITPTDPGIIKLAEIRSGVYAGVGDVTITAESEARQLLGLEPDPLQAYAFSVDPNPFLDSTLPKLLSVGVGLVGGAAIADAVVTAPTLVKTLAPKIGGAAWQGGTTSFQAFRDSLIRQVQQRATMVRNFYPVSARTFSAVRAADIPLPPILARLYQRQALASR